MYVITAHQRHGQTDVKRSHDRYIAKACSGKNTDMEIFFADTGKNQEFIW